MAAGIPGVGVGGLFYLVCALIAPLREAYRAIGHVRTRAGETRRHGSLWKQSFRLAAMAAAILAAMWLTGLLIGNLLRSMSEPAHTSAMRPPVRVDVSLWKINALVLSIGTLALVLGAVQIARMTVSTACARARTAARIARSSTMLLGAALAFAVPSPLDAQGRSPRTAASVALLRSRAESTYATGDRPASERAYEALVEAAPNDSRALFRLAGLRASISARVSLLQRYVAVEPGDAWGWLALAAALSADGRPTSSDSALLRAERIAPRERDVMLARARSSERSGRTDASIAQFEALVRADAKDAEAWQGLAEQRRRAGHLREGIGALSRAHALRPTARRTRELQAWTREAGMQFEPTLGLTRDSDVNMTQRASLAVRLPLARRTAFALGATTLSARNTIDFAGSPTVRAGFVSATWRPRATLTTEATVAATQVRAARPTATTTTPVQTTTPTGLVRVRWRGAADGPAIDMRVTRVQLDATPLLVSNRVVRTEGGLAVDVPLAAGFRARGLSRTAAITTLDEPENRRTVIGGSLVRPIRGWGEIAVNGQHITVARSTTQGYFAPRTAQIAELSAYIERESDSGVLLALDAGAGMQRVRTFDSNVTGTWQPAARLWTHLDVPVHRQALLRAEVDLYDGGVARDATTAAHWRWISAALGIRVTP